MKRGGEVWEGGEGGGGLSWLQGLRAAADILFSVTLSTLWTGCWKDLQGMSHCLQVLM